MVPTSEIPLRVLVGRAKPGYIPLGDGEEPSVNSTTTMRRNTPTSRPGPSRSLLKKNPRRDVRYTDEPEDEENLLGGPHHEGGEYDDDDGDVDENTQLTSSQHAENIPERPVSIAFHLLHTPYSCLVVVLKTSTLKRTPSIASTKREKDKSRTIPFRPPGEWCQIAFYDHNLS